MKDAEFLQEKNCVVQYKYLKVMEEIKVKKKWKLLTLTNQVN